MVLYVTVLLSFPKHWFPDRLPRDYREKNRWSREKHVTDRFPGGRSVVEAGREPQMTVCYRRLPITVSTANYRHRENTVMCREMPGKGVGISR